MVEYPISLRVPLLRPGTPHQVCRSAPFRRAVARAGATALIVSVRGRSLGCPGVLSALRASRGPSAPTGAPGPSGRRRV
ncbi:hypothetical protein NDU88_003069 [Pleurodeles waltl]|uniref:Uncharacterized protein n=1 Tax=Pleurodeles waltl TaxID=8319 RepID=A0AAV7MT81_PLEWA|nr:hypothetical protein NDU88_003069 [Pleurodeles waltl]